MRSFSAPTVIVLLATGVLAARQSSTPAKAPPIPEAKGMPARASAADYASQATAGSVTIGAEFMGHSVPRVEGPYSTEDYVVIETGFFGAPGARLNLSTADFSLRVNGKKSVPSSPYGMVLGSLKDPEWIPPTPPEKSKSGINTGGQNDSGPPPPAHMPIELVRAMSQYVQQSALPEGDRALPVAGLIFFQFRSKTQNIHALELVYTGAAGKATLDLHP